MTATANPALPAETFNRLRFQAAERSEAMTITGTIYKTLLLLLLASLSAGWVWIKFYQSGNNGAAVTPWVGIGALGGFVMAMVTSFKKEWSPITSPVYAVMTGLFIGGFSAQLEALFPGIVIQAAALTLGVLFSMLIFYQAGVVRATEKFKLGVFAATGAIAIVYLAAWILSFFGIQASFIYGTSWLSIGVSLVVVAVAALNLVIDFDFIEQGASQQVPKYMEWYGAFALMVTLVWLYIEFVRLLSKLREK